MTNKAGRETAGLPLAVSRALKQAKAHPSVKDARFTRQSNGFTFAEISIKTELPGKWRAKGESPFGVRDLEVATVGFAADFPLSAPWIVLRKDFPRTHPHIQPGKPDQPVRPCLVLGSPREVVQARGFIGLIEQLVQWLDKAAELELIDPKVGWESVRRDTIDDIIVADAARLRGLVTATGGSLYSFGTYLLEGETYKLHCDLDPTPLRQGSIAILKRTEHKGYATGTGLLIAAWPGRKGGKPIVAGEYLPEDVVTVGDLLTRADKYGCQAELEGKLKYARTELTARPTDSEFPLAVVLLARRPYNLIGADSPLEICPYIIEVAPGLDFLDPATPVRLAAHRNTVSPELLRETSGEESTEPTVPWTMVGCGSVGSKIALHAARAGRAPTVLVDKDYLTAHNFARHTALARGELDAMFYRAKAAAVGAQIEALGQKSAAYGSDIIKLMATDAGRDAFAPEGTRMIVDTTGSITTREAMAHAWWPGKPRIVEACLLGAGRLVYLTREGPASNPSISDLAAEAYRLIADDDALAAAAFGAEAEEIAIGQGCSAVTFRLSDAQLSVASAALAAPIQKWASAGLPDCGLVRIGQLNDDQQLEWISVEEAPWIEVPGNDQIPSVRIHPRVDAAIAADVAAWPGVETGGVLVGRFSNIGNLFQIVDLLPAPPDSTRSASEFVLGTQGLKQAAHRIATRTRGALQVVGTWHSHLAPSGPSTTDMVAGVAIAVQQLGPALLLIHTPHGYSRLVAEEVFQINAGEKEEAIAE